MVECTKCAIKYSTERMFCGKCGETLGIRCPVCGFVNLLDDVFCGNCRTRLRSQAEVSIGRDTEESASLSRSLFEELNKDAQEDAGDTGVDEGISQEDIDQIFGTSRSPRKEK